MIEHYKFKTKPYEHQLKALQRSWDQETFALFMEMGTGKSKVLIDNIAPFSYTHFRSHETCAELLFRLLLEI